MALTFSPESWVAGYIKSATKGTVISIRLRRILTLVFIPIWIGSIVFSIPSYMEAFKAVPKYNRLQELKKGGIGLEYDDNNCYGGHVHKSWVNDGESTHQCGCFNSQFWMDMGIGNPDHRDSVDGLFAMAESNQKGELFKFLILPQLFLMFFAAPWLIIRVIYWIKDAEKITEETSQKGV